MECASLLPDKLQPEAGVGPLFRSIRHSRIKIKMVTFIETKLFTSLIGKYLSDDEYAALQSMLASNPTVGDLVQGTGGVRKIRWGVTGRGKRGGLRVIYFARTHLGEIWMLTIYAKNVAESIPAKILRQIREEIDG